MNKRQKKKKTKSLQTRYDDLYKKYQEAESNINALNILVTSKDQVIIKQALLINMYRGHYGIGPFKEEKDDI